MEADVCVVGAGAAGIVLATELTGSGLRVCLVEAGDLHPDEETQSLHELDCVGQPVREDFMSRARYYGGTCNLWAGRSMRLGAFDLEARPWVEASGWPLSEAELAPWYERAGRILRLPSADAFDPAPYLGRSGASEGRLFADDPFQPTVSLWSRRPMRFGSRYRRALVRSDRTQLVLNANVTEVRLDSGGRSVESLVARTLEGHELTLRARHFVLACGGLENARLLLASRGHHESGVGNHHDWVGRTFMDHPRAVYGRVRLRESARLPYLLGVPLRDGKVQLGVGLDHEQQRREGLLNHYATFEAEYSDYARAGYGSAVRWAKILLHKGYAGRRGVRRARLAHVPELIYLLTPKELLPHGLWRMARATKNALLRSRGPQQRIVVYYCEQPPRRASRVTLGSTRDRLGVPRLVLDWRLGQEVTRSLLRLQDILAGELERRGLGTLEPGEGEPHYTDASHHMGTTRMSEEARDGVVDVNGRVHDVANLYLAGSSVFPSAGHANPTLTIVALALRLAEHLAIRGTED